MSEPTQPRTALVVDDDAILRKLVVRGLEPLGFTRILEADDGEPARALLETHDVDIVITDLLMPGLDGPELIRWAQRLQPGPDWIILSGVETFDAALDAIHLGAFDFLTKPPDLRELRIAVRNALSQRELIRERERLLKRLQESSLELLEQLRELEEQSEQIRNDLRRAETIQRALLPSRPPEGAGLRFESLYRPGKHVGGDLYDVATTPTGEIVFYVADATGHGVSAAMLSVLFKQRLLTVDDGGCVVGPGLALQRANHYVTRDLAAPGLFLTAAYGVLEPASRIVRLASAGHPAVAHWRAKTGDVELYKRTGPAIGLESVARYGEHRFRLEPDDRLLLYSDGATEIGDEPPRERIVAALGRLAGGEALDAVFADGAETADGDHDDTTLLMIEAASGVSHLDNGDHRRADDAEHDAEDEDEDDGTAPAVAWVRTRGATTFVALVGRATWPHCDRVYRTARATLDGGGAVVIDLSDCQHLDSTFLGSIHDLVARAPDRVQVQGLSARVRELFEELGLERVLARSGGEPVALPGDLEPLRTSTTTARETQLRLLRAHETLAEISSENRDKFAAIVEALRAELG